MMIYDVKTAPPGKLYDLDTGESIPWAFWCDDEAGEYKMFVINNDGRPQLDPHNSTQVWTKHVKGARILFVPNSTDYDKQHLDFRICEKCDHVASYPLDRADGRKCSRCGSDHTRKCRESEAALANRTTTAVMVLRGKHLYYIVATPTVPPTGTVE